MRSLFALALFVVPAMLLGEDKKEPEFVVHTGHFEKQDTGLKGESSLLLLTDNESFTKYLGAVPPSGLGGGVRKYTPVTKDVFDQKVVAVVIKRGHAITLYTEVSTKTEGDTLTMTFKSQEGKPNAGTFASPLVVAVPKGTITRVVFVENGKEIGTAK